MTRFWWWLLYTAARLTQLRGGIDLSSKMLHIVDSLTNQNSSNASSYHMSMSVIQACSGKHRSSYHSQWHRALAFHYISRLAMFLEKAAIFVLTLTFQSILSSHDWINLHSCSWFWSCMLSIQRSLWGFGLTLIATFFNFAPACTDGALLRQRPCMFFEVMSASSTIS